MSPLVETSTPPNTPKPIGPYSHIAKVGSFITIGGTYWMVVGRFNWIVGADAIMSLLLLLFAHLCSYTIEQ